MALRRFGIARHSRGFWTLLALPRSIWHWWLTTLRERLVKIAANVVKHSRSVILLSAEVPIPRELFAAILSRIQQLAPART